MPRPRKCRRVCCLPKRQHFGPLDGKEIEEMSIVMTVDEFESIRLIDLEELTQEECAKRMDVARTTAQGIYNGARKKLAECLVHGKRLQISGGDYTLCGNGTECHCIHCPKNK